MNKFAQNFRDLEVYKQSFGCQQEIFRLSRGWPDNEKFALTDQIRRSSRSVGANLAEAWAKRHYPALFRSKLTDADGELQETLHWWETARACEYVNAVSYEALKSQLGLIGRMIGTMIAHYESFCLA